MPTAVITQTVVEPTEADILGFTMKGDFTQGSGIEVVITLSLKNQDTTENRKMTFVLNASAGQKDHFAADVTAAMSTIIADVESILGVTFA